MQRALHVVRPVRPSDRGTVTVEILRDLPDEDSPTGYTEDYITLHIDGWDYTPGTPVSFHHPGDPAEITVTSAWLEGDKQTLSEADLDAIVDEHYDKIAEVIEDYTADFGT